MKPWHEWLAVANREFRGKLAKKGATAAAIKSAEKKLGRSFPKRYREFISKWNGGRLDLFKFLPLAEVVKNAKGRRGDERDPLGELPEHLVPIAEEAHGLDVYCLSTATKDERVYSFEPEEPGALKSFPDFEALLLDRLAGVAQPGPDSDYLNAVAKAHGIDWDKDDVLEDYTPWEKCRAALPSPPKPQRRDGPVSLENFEPGVLGLIKGAHSVTGQLGRGIVGTIESTRGKAPTWTLDFSRGHGTRTTTRQLGREELGQVSKAVDRYIASRGYEKDKDWSGLAAALKKSLA